MSEYLGDGQMHTLGGEEIQDSARRWPPTRGDHRAVDAPPVLRTVAHGVDCVPPNDLPRIRESPLCDRRRGQDRDGRMFGAAAARRRDGAVDVDQAPRFLDLGPRAAIQPGRSSPSEYCVTSPISSPRWSKRNRLRICSKGLGDQAAA